MPADVLPDSRPLHQLIRRTRRLLRSSWVATGAGLTLGLLLGALVGLTALDLVAPVKPVTWTVFGHLIPADSLLRLTGLLLIVVPAAWAFVAGVVRPLCRRLAAVYVARRIEEHIPGVHNRLVSCVDLEAKGRPPVSPVFHRRLLTEALDRIRRFRPHQVLDVLSLRRAALFAFITVLAFAAVWAVASHRMPRALARLFQPFADLPPLSDVAYDVVEPGKADILREEPILFTAHVTSDADPQDLRLELYNNAGKPSHTFDLKADKEDQKKWRYVVDGASLGAGYEDGFRYRIYGGGTWSKEYVIRLVERPVLVGVATAVYYPKYMGISEPHLTPPQAVEVTGPEGGEVEVRVQAQGQVATGEVQLLRPAVKLIPAHAQVEHAYFEDKLPFGVSAEGNWTWERRQNRQVHTEPVALGTHGHWFQGDPVGQAVTAGDVLFAYVYVDPQHPPETLMVQWHDGDGWEHGAYWGADRIKEGKADSPARKRVGDLPAEYKGKWVRLDVSAEAVGLAGKTVRGMAFKLHGGRCLWGRTGTVRTQEPDVEVTKSFPMKQTEDGEWAGRFPLVGSGLFRAELRNEQGHPNKPMKEMKYVALADKPPQVLVERQGSEMVLSKPAAVPLTATAFDDYGLAEINVLVREGDTGEYRSRVLERLEHPERSRTVVGSLTEAAALKSGGQLWYVVEAKDRKGQVARSREYVIRIAPDANSADQQLEAFEKSQDPFRDRLLQLIGEQKKIQEQIQHLNKEYAAVAERAQTALDQAKPKEGTVDPKGKPPEPVKLDPETARRLMELQKELAKLGQQEQQNANLAQQIAADLAKAAEQANKLEMLPKAIAHEMQTAQQQFQNLVANAMRNLGQEMSQASSPNPQNAPDLKGMQQKGDRLQKELDDAKKRLDALADARRGVREDLREALRQLQRELMNLEGNLTARELEQLKEYLSKLREQMRNLQGKQEAFEKNAEKGLDLAALKKTQEELDKETENLLAKARNLLDAKRKRGDRKPEFPDSPYTPDRDEVKVPPREEDTNEPLPNKKEGKDKAGDKGDKKGDKKDTEEDKEPLFMPALGGPREKVDPRFAGKRRPVKKTPQKGDKNDPNQERQDLEDRQNDNQRNLDEAEKSLAADQRTLEEMARQLEQALKGGQKGGKPHQGEPSEADPMMQQLQQMLNSDAMKAAMAMAGRARQGPPQQGKQPQNQPGQAPPDNPNASPDPNKGSRDAELARLDPETRALILKLPPSRLRDELIQGMSEQGPEAYRAFIQDYFKRLTENKAPGK
jgi:hypothetical protein